MNTALADVAQLVGVLSCGPNGRGFDPWSGPMPGLWVQSPVGEIVRSNQSMFLSHITVSFSLSLSLLLSLKSMKVSSGEDKIKRENSDHLCWFSECQELF